MNEGDAAHPHNGPEPMDPGAALAADLRSVLAARRLYRRPHSGRLSAARRSGRCIAGQPAATGGPLRLPVLRAGLLAVLQFASHGHLGHLRHLAVWSALRWARSPAATRPASARSRQARPCSSRSSRSSRGRCEPARSSTSSPRASWSASSAAWRSFSPARSCRSCSAFTGRTAISGRTPATSSAI